MYIHLPECKYQVFGVYTIIMSPSHSNLIMHCYSYHVSCFSHHLLASGSPSKRNGNHPVKVGCLQVIPSTLQSVHYQLILQVLENLCKYIPEVVFSPVVCSDLPVHVLQWQKKKTEYTENCTLLVENGFLLKVALKKGGESGELASIYIMLQR